MLSHPDRQGHKSYGAEYPRVLKFYARENNEKKQRGKDIFYAFFLCCYQNSNQPNCQEAFEPPSLPIKPPAAALCAAVCDF